MDSMFPIERRSMYSTVYVYVLRYVLFYNTENMLTVWLLHVRIHFYIKCRHKMIGIYGPTTAFEELSYSNS